MRAPEIELSLDDIRAVTRFATACASTVLATFEEVAPDDDRPGAALRSARSFADGGRRTHDLRTTAVAAHRAAKGTTDERARHAAMAAGDAAASAFLHPLADVTQVGHILRAAAHATAALPGRQHDAARDVLDLADDRLRAVLARYPRTGPGITEVSRIVHRLDDRLRA